MSDFARWLNGSLTRFCGHDMHDRCTGTIGTIGIESPCFCDCHERAGATGEGETPARLGSQEGSAE